MELIFLLPILLLLVLYAYYSLVYKPKKLMNNYRSMLQTQGYKVKMYPFKLLGNSVIDTWKQEQRKYGDQHYTIKHQTVTYDVGLLNVLNKIVIEIYQPELMQEFFGPQHPKLYYKIEYLTDNLKRSFGQGVLFSEGEVWKQKRKIMNSVFNYDFLKSNIPKFIKIHNENFERVQKEYFQKNPDASKDTIKMDVLELFTSVYSNVMLEAFFGIPSTYDKIQGKLLSVFLTNLNVEILEQSFRPLSLLLGIKFLELGLTHQDREVNRKVALLRSIATDKIQQRLKILKKEGPKEQYTDIIEALMQAKKLDLENACENSQKYNFKDLIDQFFTFYTAGTETTAHFIQMMIYYLFLNPQVQVKARLQISKVIHSDEDITTQNLKKITYIDWIQNETTRMYGPGSSIVIRYARQDNTLKDIPIRKGMGVTILPVMNHYSEKYYKDPLVFRPQRWQENNNHPFAFAGFSGGPRTCIGKHLALLESKIGLIKFLLRYKQFSLPKKDFKLLRKFTLQPEFMQLTAVLSKV